MRIGVAQALRSHQVPATTIKGQYLVLRVRPPAILRQAQDSMGRGHEVRVLELRGERAKLDLKGLEGPLRPNLAFPKALLVLPSDHHKVTVLVGGQAVAEGLQGHTNARPQVQQLHMIVLVGHDGMEESSDHDHRRFIFCPKSPLGFTVKVYERAVLSEVSR